MCIRAALAASPELEDINGRQSERTIMDQKSDLNSYFSELDLLKMSEYQKMRMKNQVEKYHKLKEIGMDVSKPKFMEKVEKSIEVQENLVDTKGKKKKRKIKDSSDEEDEWLPENELKISNRKSGQEQRQKKSKKILHANNEEPLQVDKVGPNTSGEISVRYSKRTRKIPNYKEPTVPDCDDFIFCDECEREWEGDCADHPLQIVEDKQVPKDKSNDQRAIDTTPSMLAIDKSKIPDGGLGVWARKVVPYRTRFGPYEGTVVPADVSTGYGWEIFKNGKRNHCIDASEPGMSNWMRYVNCARHKDEQNLFAFQYRGQVFYRTTRNIAPLEELLVYYGDDYGQDLGIDPDQFKAKLDKPLKELFFDCQTCKSTFCSPIYLERHRCSEKRGTGTDTWRELSLPYLDSMWEACWSAAAQR